MFIELSEFLRCPEPHQETFCVVAPDQVVGRMILRGVVGCPVCRREYRIDGGVAYFAEGPGGAGGTGGAGEADPDVVWALLGLTGPGGFVVLVGGAARLAGPLGARISGVHLVGVNPPVGVEMSPGFSLLHHPSRIPLRTSMARGVVLGADAAREPWLSEGARVLLNGLRLVAVVDAVSVPGVDRLAEGRGLWVGQKAGRTGSGPKRRPASESR